MFVYDYRSPILAATTHTSPLTQLLFPFMNFTCDGNITRLMFVANRSRHRLSDSGVGGSQIATSWPVFSLWHQYDSDQYREMRSMVPFCPDERTPASVTDDVLVEAVNVIPHVRFEAGDILGLRQPFQHCQNTGAHGQSSNWQSQLLNCRVKLLRQRGGYGLTQICTPSTDSGCQVWDMGIEELQQTPYIAIETLTSKTCSCAHAMD